ncbi:MAG: phosphate signaling complex protein PhoU [Phycisphaerae bacterium]
MPAHFNEQLEQLRGEVARVASKVQEVLEFACDVAMQADAHLVPEVKALDRLIDADEVRIEGAAIDLIALHQPAASDLRLLMTVIKVNSDLERIADCSKNIAGRSKVLARSDGSRPPRDLRILADSVTELLRDVIKAYNLSDTGLAAKVVASDEVIDALYQQIVAETTLQMESGKLAAARGLAYVMIAKNLERIGDHCTNIAEDVLYVSSGAIRRHQRREIADAESEGRQD